LKKIGTALSVKSFFATYQSKKRIPLLSLTHSRTDKHFSNYSQVKKPQAELLL